MSGRAGLRRDGEAAGAARSPRQPPPGPRRAVSAARRPLARPAATRPAASGSAASWPAVVQRPSASVRRPRTLPEWIWSDATGFVMNRPTRDDASARWPYRRAISEDGQEARPAHLARCCAVFRPVRPNAGSPAAGRPVWRGRLPVPGPMKPAPCFRPAARGLLSAQFSRCSTHTALLFPPGRSRGPAIMKSHCLAMPEAGPGPSGAADAVAAGRTVRRGRTCPLRAMPGRHCSA